MSHNKAQFVRLADILSALTLVLAFSLANVIQAHAQGPDQKCFDSCMGQFGTAGSCVRGCPAVAPGEDQSATNPAIECHIKCLQSYAPCAQNCFSAQIDNGETPTSQQQGSYTQELNEIKNEEAQLKK